MSDLDVVCVGETMAQITPADAGSVESAELFRVTAGGAESNVAIGLAQLGNRAAWLGRVGADALGRRVVAGLRAEGVDTHLARTDEAAPTGMFVKAPGPEGSVVTYYRRDSAGSRLAPADVESALAGRTRHVHLSGVTAALSPSALAATRAALAIARDRGITASFDVNHRPVLWPDAAVARDVLRELAAAATVVFVGLDEAQRLWGVDTPADCRDLLPGVAHLVVKDGAVEAIEYGDAGRTAVPARPVDVVEAVGAGDAFASGWLHGLLAGEDATTRLRFGHLMAARALTSRGDYALGAIDPEALGTRARREWAA